jgi:hypothetical protein
MGRGVMSTRTALAWTCAGLLALAGAGAAWAQPTQQPGRAALAVENDDGGYRATKKYADVRDRVVKARMLERLRDFLSPIRLPRSVGLLAAECDGGAGAGPFYLTGDRTITICYQFVAAVEKVADTVIAAQRENPQFFPFPVTRDEFIWGLLGGVMLHESGHALFDVLDVPMFGREEDAADQFAILIALKLRPPLAVAAVKAYAYFWRGMSDPDAMTKDGDLNQDFADEHGTPSQRLFNGLCIAYGRSPEVFGKFVAAGWLPAQRAKGCAREYAQLEQAFTRTVLPFIDSTRMAEMENIDWLAANYGPAQPAPAASTAPANPVPASKSAQGPDGRGDPVGAGR